MHFTRILYMSIIRKRKVGKQKHCRIVKQNPAAAYIVAIQPCSGSGVRTAHFPKK